MNNNSLLLLSSKVTLAILEAAFLVIFLGAFLVELSDLLLNRYSPVGIVCAVFLHAVTDFSWYLTVVSLVYSNPSAQLRFAVLTKLHSLFS